VQDINFKRYINEKIKVLQLMMIFHTFNALSFAVFTAKQMFKLFTTANDTMFKLFTTLMILHAYVKLPTIIYILHTMSAYLYLSHHRDDREDTLFILPYNC
jgi:hypothetical protein